MANIKSRLLAGVLAVVTAATPTASYASVIDIDNDVVSISTATDKETSSKFLFITLKTKGGSVILNKDTVDQQVIKLDYHNVKVDESGKTEKKLFIEVYDKDEILLFSEEAEKNKNTYMYEVEADKVVTVDAVADEGYGITGFEGTEGEVEDKLGEELRPSFTYPVFMDEDAKVSVKFGEIPKEEAPPVEEETDETAGEEDLTVEQPEAAEGEDIEESGDDEAEADEDLTVGEGEEAEADADLTVSEDEESEDDEDLTVNEDEEVEDEADLTVNEGEADEVEDNEADEDLTMGDSEDSDNLLEEPNDLTVEQPEAEEDADADADADDNFLLTENNAQPEEHFADFTEEIYTLDATQFETARLVIMTDSADDIVDKEHLIASYDDLYLLQYKTVEQSMAAYLHYVNSVHAVEPDMKVYAASETLVSENTDTVIGATPKEVEGLVVDDTINPISMLSEEIVSSTIQNTDNVIALIDTGASAGLNVIDRVSMLDDKVTSDNAHADMMVNAIVSQNPDAKIVSIRALGDNGYGATSSIVAALDYAIKQKVSIINLSMYSKGTFIDSVINAKIQEAMNAGIIVVGAAGNDGADASEYMPGCENKAYIIGAANKNGVKLESSNYGHTVDYNVIAENTSEAAAKFTGYISANGIDSIETNKGIIFDTDYFPDIDVSEIPEMKVYYLCYQNDSVEDVITNFISKYPVELLEDGTLRSYINPCPDWVDYNNLYDETGVPIDVDINRGIMGGWQTPITEECTYNDEEGYIDIPGRYAGQDLTVTVWQSVDSMFYRNAVPDDIKPERYRGRQISLFTYKQDWPWGIANSFKARGCNSNVTIKGDISTIKVGDTYNIGSNSYTHYIGDSNSWTWSMVKGSSAYDPYFGSGQVTNIQGCSNPIFNNIGAPGPDGKNYLFGGCISDVCNNFAGQPIVTSGYIECISKSGDTAEFYLKVRCRGSGWEAAQTVAATFTAEFEPLDGSVKITKRLGNADMVNTSELVYIKTKFTIFTNAKCRKSDIYKTIAFKGGPDEDRAYQLVENMEPGDYWIKEVDGNLKQMQCPGTIHNTKTYKFTVVAGKTTTKFTEVESGEESSTIPNTPFEGRFKILKKDKGTGKPLPGAVFQVKYYGHKRTDTSEKAQATWFFKTEKTGYAYYSDSSYLDSWTNPKTGKTYNSSPPITLTNGKWYLPLSYIYVKEVQAPDGYALNSEIKEGHIKADSSQMENGLYTKSVCPTIEFVVEDKIVNDPWKVRVQAKKINKTLEGLEGAIFGVYDTPDCDGDELARLTSESNGMTNIAIIDDIPVEKTEYTLYLKELSAPNGCAPTEEIFKLTFTRDEWNKLSQAEKDAGGQLKIFGPKDGIINEEFDGWKVRVNLKKVKEDLSPLAGAVFGVYDENKELIGKLTSGEDGMSNILTVYVPIDQEDITLYCEEIEPPEGYGKLDEVFNLTFYKKDYDALSEEEKAEGELKTFGPEDGIVNVPGWKVRVNIKKVKEDLSPLAGAEFEVYDNIECTGKPLGKLISGDDGMAKELTIPVSSKKNTLNLYCKEVKAPDGYAILEDVFSLTFEKSDYDALSDEDKEKGELKIFGPEEGIINKDGWKIRVQLKKVDGKGKPVAGAVFGLYDDAACANSVGQLTSGADGMSDIATVPVGMDKTEITIYCKEITAPPGYILSETVYNETFTKEVYDSLVAEGELEGELKQIGVKKGIPNNTPTPTPYQPEPGKAGLYIKKTSTVDPEILELNGYSLADAEFEVTSDRADGGSGTLKTGENGISDSLALPDNHKDVWHDPVYDANDNLLHEGYWEPKPVATNYTIRETKPPKGHQMNYTPKYQRVVMPDDKNKTFEIPFEDEPIFCKNKLDIEKLGSKGNPIEGVVFRVELFDSPTEAEGDAVKTWYLESDKNGKIYLDEAHITHRLNFQSDPFFMHKGKIVIPIDCYLQFTEVAAPAEYIINGVPFGMPTGEDAELTKRAYNEPEPCEVKIKKYEADGSTPITGVEFEIKFLEEAIHANGNKHPNFKRLLEVGQTYVAHTDENGELVFKNLDQGKYEITEIKTETGHGLLKEPIIVTLPMTMTREEAEEYGNVDFDSAKEDSSYTDKWFFYSCLYEVTNNANLKMPMSGGLGDWKYGFIGMGVIAMIGTSLIVHESLNKKRRKTHKRKKQSLDDFKI